MGLQAMGRLPQAAAHKPGGRHPQALEHRLSGTGATGHTFRQQQGPPRLEPPQLLAPAPAAREQLVHPLQFDGGPSAEAAGGAMAQLQMRNRRCHSSAGIHHQRLQPQLLHHHPSDQSGAHAGRQGRQGMGAQLRWAKQQQLRIGGGGEPSTLRCGTSRRDPRHRSRGGAGQQQQHPSGLSSAGHLSAPTVRLAGITAEALERQRGSRASSGRSSGGGGVIGLRRRGKIHRATACRAST